MKTADLIPLILLELNESNKYGLEMTKSIETKSNGKIIIKQPTLYTILKKLEKSKFISSYWEDSDIGGKRHYYKITDNGRLQVSTLPSMQELITMIINGDSNEDEADFEITTQNNEQPQFTPDESKEIDKIESNKPIEQKSQSFSIMDMLDTPEHTTVESVLPSEEVFNTIDIDHSTELEINQANKDLIKDTESIKEESFANNKEVSKFTEKPSTNISQEYKEKLTSLDDNLTPRISPQEAISINRKEIKHVDYVDFKKDENYIYANRTTKNMLYKILATTGYLVFILAICALATSLLHTSAMYYFCLILSVCFIVFYPAVYAFKYQEFKEKLQKDKLNINMKKRLIVFIAIELVVVIACIIINFSLGINTLGEILNIHNFANFYTPILLSTAMFADYLFTYLFLIKERK